MKRKLLTMVLAVVAVAAFTGCGQGDAEKLNQNEKAMNEYGASADSAVQVDEISNDTEIVGDQELEEYPANEFEVRVGRTSFDSYDEIIGLLEGDEAYTWAKVKGYDGEVLLVSDFVFDDLLGHIATTECTPYTMKANGEVTADSPLYSGGSNTPITIDDDGFIYTATHMSVDKNCYGDNGTENPAIMIMATVSTEEYDDNGDPSKVFGFVRTNNSLVEDTCTELSEDDLDFYKSMFDDYYNSEVISFTKVSGDTAISSEADNTINPPVLTDMELYDSVISELKPGQAYAFADMCENYDVLLVSEDGVYDYDGNNAAINAKIYGVDADNNVIELGEANSGHTAYPISVYDGCILFANNEQAYMQYVDTNTNDIFTKKTAQVYYEDGKPSYYYSDMDTQFDGLVDDDSKLNEMYELFDKATIVNFTVVE